MYQDKLAGRPLRFGDADQIKTLHLWQRDIELLEKQERARNDPNAPLIVWRVRYSYRMEEEEYFDARTAEEAEEMATEEYEYEDDFRIEYCEAKIRS